MLPVEEQLNVDLAIAQVITQWSYLEKALLETLIVLTVPAKPGALAGSFFAVENFRSKLGMINAAAQLVLGSSPELAAWSSIERRCRKAATKRNHLSHYQILIVPQNSSGSRVLLRPSLSNPLSPSPASTFPEAGYRLVDLQNIMSDLSAIRMTVENFSCRVSGQPEPHEKFREQATHRRTADNLLNHILREHGDRP